jgi:hypothetical protein
VLGDRVDLCPRLERALLWVLPPRVVDAPLGRIESMIFQATARFST